MNSRVFPMGDTLAQFNLLDEVMPVMLAHIDRDLRYQYHNSAFRDWLGLKADAVNGHTMREVLGEKVYAGIERRVALVMDGHTVRYERTQKTPTGGAVRLFVNLVPHIDPEGTVAGMFAIIIEREHQSRGRMAQAVEGGTDLAARADGGDIDQALLLLDQHVAVDNTGWRNIADRIKHALKNDEFMLYAQRVRDLQSDSSHFFRICLRISEEEEGRMHPGTFMPLAEQHGMMRDLDRWTVTNLLKTVAAMRHARSSGPPGAYCVPLHRDLIADPDFPGFLRDELDAHKVPGEALRFELQTGDVRANLADAASLLKELRSLHCGSVLADFGRDSRDIHILKAAPVDFVVIDSSIIFRILSDEGALGMVRRINDVAHAAGVKTIAELVESEESIAKLQEIGVDYAQGMAIGSPGLMRDCI